MGLFDTTDGLLVRVLSTSFAAKGVPERTHLQAVLRENVSLVGDDLFVVPEEFGNFRDANQRFDLLCIDREANFAEQRPDSRRAGRMRSGPPQRWLGAKYWRVEIRRPQH